MISPCCQDHFYMRYYFLFLSINTHLVYKYVYFRYIYICKPTCSHVHLVHCFNKKRHSGRSDWLGKLTRWLLLYIKSGYLYIFKNHNQRLYISLVPAAKMVLEPSLSVLLGKGMLIFLGFIRLLRPFFWVLSN